MPLATTWVNLEDTTLSEEARHRKKRIEWFHLYVESKSLTHRSREYDGGEENAEMLVKCWTLSGISSRGLMCSMVTVVNNTVLYTWNLQREYILSVLTRQRRNGTVWGNGCVN